MRIVSTELLNNNLGLSIVEVDEPIIRLNFEKRFQVIVLIKNKNVFPRDKNKFLSFYEKNYIYQLKSEITNEPVMVNEVLYHKKQLCDKSYEECSHIVHNHLFAYLGGKDIMLDLKRDYKI